MYTTAKETKGTKSVSNLYYIRIKSFYFIRLNRFRRLSLYELYSPSISEMIAKIYLFINLYPECLEQELTLFGLKKEIVIYNLISTIILE